LPYSIIVADFLKGHRLTLSFLEDFSSVVELEAGIGEGVVGWERDPGLVAAMWEGRDLDGL
jgi:hypothetical protein